jgi:hypothetical protein
VAHLRNLAFLIFLIGIGSLKEAGLKVDVLRILYERFLPKMTVLLDFLSKAFYVAKNILYFLSF